MTSKEIRDKLEIGLKPDAPYRPTNLPESQQPHPPHPAGTDPDQEDKARPDETPGTHSPDDNDR